MTELIIVVLVLLLIGQQVYWGIITQKLTNKIMSANYGNYVAAKEQAKPKAKQVMEVKLEDPLDNEDLRLLNDMIRPF